MQTVVLVEEDNHGLIGVAKDYTSAVNFLINENWLDETCRVWADELDEDYTTQSIKDNLGENWKEIISTWDIEKFNNYFDCLFYLKIEGVYGAD
jgi:hypothetical protein